MIKLSKLPRQYLQSYGILTLSEFISGMLVPLATLIFFSQVTPFFSHEITESDKLWLYGIFASFTQFAAMLANPIIGSISDQIGRKRSLLICVAGIGMLVLLAMIAAFLKNFWILLIGFINFLVRVAKNSVKSKGEEDEGFRLEFISNNVFSSPELSIEEATKEVAKFGEITEDYMMECFQDRVGYPAAICQSPGTLASMVMNVTRCEMHVANGDPSETDFVTHKFD